MTHDFAAPPWTVFNGGSTAQLAGYALRRAGMMETSPKAALFEKTMLPHLDVAFNLARWLTRNEQDAEDIVQEAYLRAFRFLAVVRKTALTGLRRERTATQVSFDEEMHGTGSGAATVEEISYREIAEAASAPIDTVMSRLSRARQSLQDSVAARMNEVFK
jgi:DNA-directed RNA polymerase specialized sigma24 family protein